MALFEADENRPLTRWKENAVKRNAWDARCEVFLSEELSLLEKSYEEADSRQFDYALADTKGGSSELNNTIIASSNFLLVPTMLTPLDVDEALATYRYIIELLLAEKLVIPTAMLRQRVPVGRMTVSQKAVWEMLNALPLMDSPMYERDAFAAMKDRGMLHLTIRNISADPASHLALRNLQTAMDELQGMAKHVIAGLGD